MTSTPNVRSLARFREGETKAPKKVWHPPVVLGEGSLLVFDQSLTSTGWVRMSNDTEGLVVADAGTVGTKPENYPAGHEGSLQRALVVAQGIERVVARHHRHVERVVHEVPPLAVGRMSRPEASLLAALGVRMAAQKHGLPVSTVQNQHSKKVLLGVSREVTKKQWHSALSRYPVLGRERVTNEGQRDALCLGITWLIDLAEDLL